MTEYKSINVRPETYVRLRQAGISGESMDVIINRALDALLCGFKCTDPFESKK